MKKSKIGPTKNDFYRRVVKAIDYNKQVDSRGLQRCLLLATTTQKEVSFPTCLSFKGFATGITNTWLINLMNKLIMLSNMRARGEHLFTLTALNIPDFVMERFDMSTKLSVGVILARALIACIIP